MKKDYFNLQDFIIEIEVLKRDMSIFKYIAKYNMYNSIIPKETLVA